MKRFFSHPFLLKHFSQGIKFALCGSIGACIDLGSLTIFVEVFFLNPNIAFIFSTILAVVFVFIANKHFTFQNRERSYGRQAFKFALVYGASFVFNISLSSLFYWWGLYYLLAKVLAIGTVSLWNYSLSHGFVFKKNEEVDTVVF